MTVHPGTHELGPDDGELLLRTSCEGAMARMGHDLTLVVERWHATLVLGTDPEGSSLRMTADLGSLRVRGSEGGAGALSDDDARQIEQNARESLHADTQPELAFTSTAADGSWEAGRLEGSLTLHGRTETQGFTVTGGEGAFTLTGEVSQRRHGITPYSTMMGALRVADVVAVEARITLPR